MSRRDTTRAGCSGTGQDGVGDVAALQGPPAPLRSNLASGTAVVVLLPSPSATPVAVAEEPVAGALKLTAGTRPCCRPSSASLRFSSASWMSRKDAGLFDGWFAPHVRKDVFSVPGGCSSSTARSTGPLSRPPLRKSDSAPRRAAEELLLRRPLPPLTKLPVLTAESAPMTLGQDGDTVISKPGPLCPSPRESPPRGVPAGRVCVVSVVCSGSST
mmetsp:Transcript_19442/g.66093  ORF Transcript_19442/g.66093 Transcript_19442/m.66093 type:complete len:215 (-) Transcript_19442:1261-1905(-)